MKSRELLGGRVVRHGRRFGRCYCTVRFGVVSDALVTALAITPADAFPDIEKVCVIYAFYMLDILWL